MGGHSQKGASGKSEHLYHFLFKLFGGQIFALGRKVVGPSQSDQIGRIFAQWVIVCFG
jgi:hypothetical protein